MKWVHEENLKLEVKRVRLKEGGVCKIGMIIEKCFVFLAFGEE